MSQLCVSGTRFIRIGSHTMKRELRMINFFNMHVMQIFGTKLTIQ